MAPRRGTLGLEPGLDAVRRAFAGDPALAERLVTHIRNTPRRAMVRAQAEQLVDAERRRRTDVFAAAKRLQIPVWEVDAEALSAWYLLRANEWREQGRVLVAASLEVLANDPDAAYRDRPEETQAAVEAAEQLVERATAEPELAKRLATEAHRETYAHLIGEVEDVPTVRAEIERREAEEARDRFRHQLASGTALADVVPESELQEDVLREVSYEVAVRGGASRR